MTETIDIAAHYAGVDVPNSPFLNEKRIERINAGRYEGAEIAGAMKIVRKGDRVLELGAGLGIVGAVISKNCAPQKVISYEANPSLIPHIQALYDQNGLAKRHTVVNEVLIAAPDRPATMPFVVHNSFLGSSLSADQSRAKEVVDVPTGDFNAAMKRFKPDVLVMDIEGGELDILRHADLTGVRAIVIEFHPEHYEVSGMKECKNVLRDAGFVRDDEVSTRIVWTAERRES